MKKLQVNEEKRKKLDNFWYYYKYHVLAGIFALFCIVIFVKDMLTKIDYDYSIGILGNYSLDEETKASLQKWFEERAEDLNGDGEVHVQISDYFLPDDSEGGYDPQMYAASQTKFTVDLQEGTSMLFFVSDENYEKFKDMEVFSTEETDLVNAEDCAGFQEIGSPVALKDLKMTLRLIDQDTKMAKDQEKQKYYASCEELMKEFAGQ